MLTAGEDSPRLKAKNALGSTIKVLTTINHMRRCSNEVWSLKKYYTIIKIITFYAEDFFFEISDTKPLLEKNDRLTFFFESDKQILREVIESDWMHEIPKEN